MIQSPISEFIATLKDTGYTLRVEDGRLKVIHPSRPLTDEEREFIREHKPNIIQAVQDTPDLDAWRREYIAREQEGWTPERRQALEDEIRRIEKYRRARGPRPSGPPAKLDRAEVFAAIGAVMNRLAGIWPVGLDVNPVWQDRVNEAATGDRETFLATVQEWEASETRRVEEYIAAIRREVAGWPDEYRKQFNLMVKGFMNQDRGLGITVRGLNLNAAQEKAYRDLLPFIPADADADSPAPAHADDFPFHDMHPATREILLRHWRTWDAARRKCFVQTIKDVMKRTGYSEGNAAAFVLQTAGPVAPGRPPAMSPEEKQALHKRMWPTPPSSPQREPKSTVPGPDIAKIVSRWPKPLRLEFAGRVGKYSNEMPINQAMSRAYAELQSTAKEN